MTWHGDFGAASPTAAGGNVPAAPPTPGPTPAPTPSGGPQTLAAPELDQLSAAVPVTILDERGQPVTEACLTVENGFLVRDRTNDDGVVLVRPERGKVAVVYAVLGAGIHGMDRPRATVFTGLARRVLRVRRRHVLELVLAPEESDPGPVLVTVRGWDGDGIERELRRGSFDDTGRVVFYGLPSAKALTVLARTKNRKQVALLRSVEADGPVVVVHMEEAKTARVRIRAPEGAGSAGVLARCQGFWFRGIMKPNLEFVVPGLPAGTVEIEALVRVDGIPFRTKASVGAGSEVELEVGGVIEPDGK